MAKQTPAKTKTCTQCGKTKPLSEFHRQSRLKDGHTAQCALCRKTQQKRYYTDNPEKKRQNHRRYILKKNFGITPEDYAAMLEQQGGVCAICGKRPKVGGRSLDVDHSHKTGKIRGLLCHLCNRGLSFFHDRPDTLRKAATYLR